MPVDEAVNLLFIKVGEVEPLPREPPSELCGADAVAFDGPDE